MAVYLDAENRFHRDGAPTSFECPHCGIRSHMRVGSVPDFAQMQIHRPKQVGIALQCDACNMPVLFRYSVREYRHNRIDFFAGGYPLERSVETFGNGYLPSTVANAFTDALGCYSNGLMNAFAVMCRRTVLAAFDELGDRGKLKCYEQVNEIQQLANIETGDFDIVRRIIFEMSLDKITDAPIITHMQAVILLETMKDMLYQVYVRGGKLEKALQLRRYFAEQAEQAQPTGKDLAPHQSEKETTAVQDDSSIIVRAMKHADRK